MKSRTLSCELTALRKDITRFAPAWILYSIFLLLMFMVSIERNWDWSTARNLGYTGSALAIINFCYGLINAQLLFGDLFNSRMANALHALPLRREGWFVTHMASGLLFSLVPNLAFTLVMAAVCGSAPALPWLWLMTAMGQYLFFFGLAVFCMICVGSRFAGVVLYGLVNFGSLLVWWMMEELYVPLLKGVVLVVNDFMRFSPVVWGTMSIPYEMDFGKMYHVAVIPENLAYLGILVALGVVLTAAALVLYRIRHLETAGDFLSVPWLKPVFLVLYSLMMGALCQWILGSITGADWIYLIIGIFIGYFTGQMLLQRTTKILSKKTFLGLAALMGMLALSMGLTWLDPLGIKTWTPAPEQVTQVEMNNQMTDDPVVIRQIVAFHEELTKDTVLSDNEKQMYITLTYTLEDGSRKARGYMVPVETYWDTLRQIRSCPDFVLEEILEIWDDAWGKVKVEDGAGERLVNTLEEWMALKEVLLLDCQAGTMAQSPILHSDSTSYYFHIMYKAEDHSIWYNIAVYLDAENTMAWLKDTGYSFELYGK